MVVRSAANTFEDEDDDEYEDETSPIAYAVPSVPAEAFRFAANS